jgi:hypothetical protein
MDSVRAGMSLEKSDFVELKGAKITLLLVQFLNMVSLAESSICSVKGSVSFLLYLSVSLYVNSFLMVSFS